MDSHPPPPFSCMLILDAQEWAETHELPTGSGFWAAIRTGSSYLTLNWLDEGLLAIWTWIHWGIPITDLPLSPLFPKLSWFVSLISLAGAMNSHWILSGGSLQLCFHEDFMSGPLKERLVKGGLLYELLERTSVPHNLRGPVRKGYLLSASCSN